QFHHAAADLEALDAGEQRHELGALGGGEDVVGVVVAAIAASHRQAFKEARGGHVEGDADIVQAAGGDAVDALLVLLDLLEGDAEEFGQALLAHADLQAPGAYALANSAIDSIRCAFVIHDFGSPRRPNGKNLSAAIKTSRVVSKIVPQRAN